MRIKWCEGLVALSVAWFGAPSAQASVSIYMPPEDLARSATLVVEGTVTRTASGFDPDAGTLSTYVTLQVDAVHRGPQDLRELVIREAGGRYGDLVHVVDAVPVYEAGERVFAFLQPAPDGALRTAGMFFGKFRLEAEPSTGRRMAVRDLEGEGRLPGRVRRAERLPERDLVAVTASVSERSRTVNANGAGADQEAISSLRGWDVSSAGEGSRSSALRGPGWRARPPETGRLLWNDVVDTSKARPEPESVAGAGSADSALLKFETPEYVRWDEADSATPVTIQIQSAGNPLHDSAAAVAEMRRAMEVWSDVPEARITLRPGDTDFDYKGAHSASPRVSYSGTNAILFGDPYEEIPDPVECSGVLAIGGYWRAANPASTVNGITFYPARQLYVIFNNGFECFLGDPDNLAEVAAHELGHGIGFAHSSASDSIMRASAYGDRGPRLGDDDVDAVHCHYPHTLTLIAPNGGESLVGGSRSWIEWSSTEESGPDPGLVDIEYSSDGGETWIGVATEVPNDGDHPWSVPHDASGEVRVRIVRHHRGEWVPSIYPEACSSDLSDGPLTITVETSESTVVPDPPSRITSGRSSRDPRPGGRVPWRPRRATR